jgi:hypothetical protein
MLRLHTSRPGFRASVRRIVNDRRESDKDVARVVQIIIPTCATAAMRRWPT